MVLPSDQELALDTKPAERDLHHWARRLSNENLAELTRRIELLKMASVATRPGSGVRGKTGTHQMRVNLTGVSLRVHYLIQGKVVKVVGVTDKDSFQIRNTLARRVKKRSKAASR